MKYKTHIIGLGFYDKDKKRIVNKIPEKEEGKLLTKLINDDLFLDFFFDAGFAFDFTFALTFFIAMCFSPFVIVIFTKRR